MIQACMSADIRIGSTPSHLMHLNFRPTMKCIGLRHFGQVRGRGFWHNASCMSTSGSRLKFNLGHRCFQIRTLSFKARRQCVDAVGTSILRGPGACTAALHCSNSLISPLKRSGVKGSIARSTISRYSAIFLCRRSHSVHMACRLLCGLRYHASVVNLVSDRAVRSLRLQPSLRHGAVDEAALHPSTM
jgi:hypothetical protein